MPVGLVHYDYHVDNLIMLRARNGSAAVGLLDFQDAVRGPCCFDLVSLIDDARRDLSPTLGGALMERYLSAFPELDRAAFIAAYALSGAQRDTRILGNFARLLRRDGKPGYLVHMPRVWRQLEAQLLHPSLAPLADWFDRHMPPERRRGMGASLLHIEPCSPPPPQPAPVKGAGAEGALDIPPPPLRGRVGVGGGSEKKDEPRG
jgi:aminoglycoside/choline kinase family phosphotransferase